MLPKFVEEYDAVPYLLSALPIAAGVLGVQLAHELAHRAVAARKQVRAPCGLSVQVCSADHPNSVLLDLHRIPFCVRCLQDGSQRGRWHFIMSACNIVCRHDVRSRAFCAANSYNLKYRCKLSQKMVMREALDHQTSVHLAWA